MPEEATVEDVEELYIESWRLGLKAVALYRDNCKVGQPLSTQKKAAAPTARRAERRWSSASSRRSSCRSRCARSCRACARAKTFSFRVADCHGYVTVGEYEDGRPGEVFLKVAKQGSTLAGIMDAFAISVSHGLQYGVPLEAFVRDVHEHALRARGHDRRPRHPVRDEPRRLHLPPARGGVPRRTTSARAMGILTVGRAAAADAARASRRRRRRRATSMRPPARRPGAVGAMLDAGADAAAAPVHAPARASARSCSATSAATSCSAPARATPARAAAAPAAARDVTSGSP